MKGVNFGNIHSYIDLNLILAPFTPTPATPQTNFLRVPGRDGSLDLTEAHGEVKYDSRVFTFTFTINPTDTMTFDEKVSEVSCALNGKLCQITLDRDPNYYWFGRCMVDKYVQNKQQKQIVVKATVNPYKLKQTETVESFTLSSSERTISLKNGRMAAIPVIKCTNNNTQVTFNGNTFMLAEGTHKALNIRFVEGFNELVLKGSGTITFTWQEGEL
jgi:hypothetical protein